MSDTAKTAEYFRQLPYTRRVRLESEPDGVSYFVAFIEELPGLSSDGATPPEALANLADAFEDYIDAMLEWGDPVPEPKPWPASVGWEDIRVPSAPVEIVGTAEASAEIRPPPEWTDKLDAEAGRALTTA